MSERSIVRAHDRELERAERRNRRRAKQVSVGVGAALGAAAFLAPSAQAASFEVNSKLDDGDGTCDATCTIRDAVDDANADAASDTITFQSGLTGTIVLENGELPIDSAMSIQGPGLEQVRISGDANRDNTAGGSDSRIFYVNTDGVGAYNDPVSISGLTLTEGYDGDSSGGAIYSYYSDLTLDEVEVTNSYAASDAGAVYSESGSLTITNSSFTDNYASSNGGALYTDDDNDTSPAPSIVTIRNSTFSGNETDGSGGAAYFDDETDTVLIDHSTFSDNFADDDGGAIQFYGPEISKAVIQDSTISGNTANEEGGGINVYDVYDIGLEVDNSTIAANTAGADGSGYGGGIYRYDTGGPVTLSSTIVADNAASSGGNDLDGSDAGAVFTAGFSLIEDPVLNTGMLTESPTGSNKLGVDPQLGGLADNGGPTRTQLIAATSPAIDSAVANGLATDQRGLPRTAEQSAANAAGSDGTDIGAVELANPDTAVLNPFVTARSPQKQRGKKIKVKVMAGAGEHVTAEAMGQIKQFRLKPLSESIDANQTETLTLTPARKQANRRIFRLLERGKRAKARISVTLSDDAGNSVTEKVKVKLKSGGGKKS